MQFFNQYRLTLLSLCTLAACILATWPELFPETEPDVASYTMSAELCQALQPTPPGYLPTFNFVPAPPLPAPPPKPKPVAKAGRQWKVPRDIVKGILYVETRSILRPDDTVKYVDKRVGRAGERGPSQIKPTTFEQVAKPGEKFERLQRDMDLALDVTERYLLWLHAQTGSWAEAAAAWNAGPDNANPNSRYRRQVTKAAQSLACMIGFNGPLQPAFR